MNANDVIESFVTEVALRLPRSSATTWRSNCGRCSTKTCRRVPKTRGAKRMRRWPRNWCGTSARLLKSAARYRTPLTIIDPEDGPAFLRATIIGLAIIWGVGLLRLRAQVEGGMDFLRALAQWWSASVLPSPWWPGLLVLGFGGRGVDASSPSAKPGMEAAPGRPHSRQPGHARAGTHRHRVRRVRAARSDVAARRLLERPRGARRL
jgi:hypothetical protein